MNIMLEERRMRNLIDYFERKIRFKNFEFWDVRIGEQYYALAIWMNFDLRHLKTLKFRI